MCNKSVDFHGVSGGRGSVTLRLCPSCWSPALRRSGTCSPLLPSSMCRWTNPEQSQATHWPEERKKKKHVDLIVLNGACDHSWHAAVAERNTLFLLWRSCANTADLCYLTLNYFGLSRSYTVFTHGMFCICREATGYSAPQLTQDQSISVHADFFSTLSGNTIYPLIHIIHLMTALSTHEDMTSCIATVQRKGMIDLSKRYLK